MVSFSPEWIILHEELQVILYKLCSQLYFTLILFQLENIFLKYLHALVNIPCCIYSPHCLYSPISHSY